MLLTSHVRLSIVHFAANYIHVLYMHVHSCTNQHALRIQCFCSHNNYSPVIMHHYVIILITLSLIPWYIDNLLQGFIASINSLGMEPRGHYAGLCKMWEGLIKLI